LKSDRKGNICIFYSKNELFNSLKARPKKRWKYRFFFSNWRTRIFFSNMQLSVSRYCRHWWEVIVERRKLMRDCKVIVYDSDFFMILIIWTCPYFPAI
jgi:hypothetical protein